MLIYKRNVHTKNASSILNRGRENHVSPVRQTVIQTVIQTDQHTDGHLYLWSSFATKKYNICGNIQYVYFFLKGNVSKSQNMTYYAIYFIIFDSEAFLKLLCQSVCPKRKISFAQLLSDING